MERKLDPEERRHNFDEVALGLSEEEVISEAKRCLKCVNPFCAQGCPTNQKIPQFVQCIIDGDMEKALELIIQDNPFPITTGKICPAFCEKKCILGIKGRPIQIRLLKRYVTEHADFSKVKIDRKPETGKRIAVMGSGPSGLSAAFYLSKEGHDVTVYEKFKMPGGMLYYGIPSYRLPKGSLGKEIELIKRAGVKIVTSHEINNIDELINEFDAVYVSTGAWKPRKLDIPGGEKAISAVDFLFNVNSGNKASIGKKVIVVGAGDVAMDAARTSVRLGSDVTVVYRRTKEDMRAAPNEIEEAEGEGVKFSFLVNPVEVKENKVKLVRMELKNGKPVPIESSEFEIDADSVILAIGQIAEKIDVDNEKVFSGGDVVSGPSTVVQALADGKNKAREINEFLKKS